MQVVSVVSGLFFKTKIDATVQRFGTNIFCSTVDEIKQLRPQVILVDLEHPQALAVLKEFGTTVIAFGPHIRTDLLAIANEFGARVYPRSIFFAELHNLLHMHQ
jgi:hypothetical protein